MAGDARFNFALEVPVRGEWRNVDLLRTSVQNCFNAAFSNIDGCHAVSMVTGELLENAVKYGDWDASEDRICRLAVVGKESTAVVSVSSPAVRESRQVAELIDTLNWIESYTSPAEAFRSRLLQIADEAAQNPSLASRLGLVRIAYEGGCKLAAELTGGVLTVTAEVDISEGR